MDELERRVVELQPSLGAPGWSDAREQHLRDEVTRKLARRKAARTQLFVSVALAAAGALTWGLTHDFSRRNFTGAVTARASTEAPPALATETIVFADGSRAAALTSDMQLSTLRQEPQLIEAQLTRGAARFEVVHNPTREFVVEIDHVRVSVLGTVFTIAHEGSRVHVAVLVGKVRVDWGAGSSVLVQDSEGVFPPPEEVTGDAPTAALDVAPSATASAAVSPPARSWVDLARAGDFRNAYIGLAKVGAAGVHDVPEELLLAADVSRRAGNAADSAQHLERLLSRYPRDSRAEVAGFTLGRVRLQLGQPSAAAAAFEQVAASGGPLAEDAAYRAVLAHRQAGEVVKATALQERYFRTYPGGRYRDALQKRP